MPQVPPQERSVGALASLLKLQQMYIPTRSLSGLLGFFSDLRENFLLFLAYLLVGTVKKHSSLEQVLGDSSMPTERFALPVLISWPPQWGILIPKCTCVLVLVTQLDCHILRPLHRETSHGKTAKQQHKPCCWPATTPAIHIWDTSGLKLELVQSNIHVESLQIKICLRSFNPNTQILQLEVSAHPPQSWPGLRSGVPIFRSNGTAASRWFQYRYRIRHAWGKPLPRENRTYLLVTSEPVRTNSAMFNWAMLSLFKLETDQSEESFESRTLGWPDRSSWANACFFVTRTSEQTQTTAHPSNPAWYSV